MRRAGRQAAATWLLVLALAGVAARGASAQDGGGVVGGPSLSLDRDVVNPGEVVEVTLTGWTGREVTLSVCGNRAARGSMDCNLVASDGVPLDRDGSPTVAELVITPPALSCPCVIRASSTRNEDLAVAPIELVGHPVGLVVEPASQTPLSITVEAERAPASLLSAIRTTLGGPTVYDVTVTVRNRTTDTLSNVVVAGAAVRSRNDAVTDLDLPAVGPLEPGQTWAYTSHATIPAPVLGEFVFEVAASGAGPAVEAEQAQSAVPIGLIVLIIVLVADVVAILWRRIARRRAVAGAQAPSPVSASLA